MQPGLNPERGGLSPLVAKRGHEVNPFPSGLQAKKGRDDHWRIRKGHIALKGRKPHIRGKEGRGGLESKTFEA